MSDSAGNKEDLIGQLEGWSENFDRLCQERHQVGQEEYGAFTFLGNDVVRMMMEELADTSNYCRMQFIKLMMLQEQIEKMLPVVGVETGELSLGGSFKGTKNIGWQQPGSEGPEF